MAQAQKSIHYVTLLFFLMIGWSSALWWSLSFYACDRDTHSVHTRKKWVPHVFFLSINHKGLSMGFTFSIVRSFEYL